jgi:hypothetical protein
MLCHISCIHFEVHEKSELVLTIHREGHTPRELASTILEANLSHLCEAVTQNIEGKIRCALSQLRNSKNLKHTVNYKP